MKEEQFKKLLEKYHKGSADEQETRAVELFLESLQQSGQSFSEVKHDLGLKSRMLKHVKEKGRRRKSTFYRAVGVAATLLIIIGSYGYFSLTGSSQKIVYKEMITHKGEQKKIILSDSSEVILNADSKIIYPAEFQSGHRVVQLEGEAYFSVQRNEKRPFTIQSNNFTTVVLGTRFTVRNYSEENSEVVVLSGSVEVSNEVDNSLILTKNERATIGEHGRMEKDHVNSQEVTSWLQGKVNFGEADLAQVARILNRRYDVDILLHESLRRSQRLSGNFSGKTVDDVLESIMFIYGIQYRKLNQSTYELYQND